MIELNAQHTITNPIRCSVEPVMDRTARPLSRSSWWNLHLPPTPRPSLLLNMTSQNALISQVAVFQI